MKTAFSDIIISITVCIALGLCSFAAYAADDDFDPFAASIEENINHPAVDAKKHDKVNASQVQLERALRKAGYQTERVRSGEVVLVTVPASSLFAANSTVLKESAVKVLRGLLPYVKLADNYKTVIAMHADNTGDTDYADSITADRAAAVDEFFYQNCGNKETGIIPYGLGNDEPVAPNSGVRNRAANRRLEVYFIPTAEYIEKVQKR